MNAREQTHTRLYIDTRREETPPCATMEIYLSAIEKAAETWEIIQAIPNYETVVGELLFRE